MIRITKDTIARRDEPVVKPSAIRVQKNSVAKPLEPPPKKAPSIRFQKSAAPARSEPPPDRPSGIRIQKNSVSQASEPSDRWSTIHDYSQRNLGAAGGRESRRPSAPHKAEPSRDFGPKRKQSNPAGKIFLGIAIAAVVLIIILAGANAYRNQRPAPPPPVRRQAPAPEPERPRPLRDYMIAHNLTNNAALRERQQRLRGYQMGGRYPQQPAPVAPADPTPPAQP